MEALPTTAFALSGGGSHGAAEVGMLLALDEAGVRPDLVVGTSVGAVNGAWLAGGQSIERLADLWRSLHRGDVFPLSPVTAALGVLGLRDHLVSPSKLRSLLRRHIDFDRLEEAPVPLHVVATDVLDGHDVVLSSGPAVEAVLASAAIPGIFPPVRRNGRALVDGGVVDNTPISHAVEAGAHTVWVLSPGDACALPEPPGSALGMALHAFSLAIHHRMMLDVQRYADQADLRVLPPLCPIDVDPVDFSKSGDLIERGYQQTRKWLADGSPAVPLTGVHHH